MKIVGLASLSVIGLGILSASLSAPAQEQTTITSPVEYNAYQKALSEPVPDARAHAIEDFLEQYPQTAAKLEALKTLLSTYQQANNSKGMLATSKRILYIDPDNLRAALVYVYLIKQQELSKGPLDAAGSASVKATGKTALGAAGRSPFGATGGAPINAAGSPAFGAAGAAPTNAAGAPAIAATGPTPRNAAGATPTDAEGEVPGDAISPLSPLEEAVRAARAALKVSAPTPGSGVSAEDFAKLKTATTPVFWSVIAFSEEKNQNYGEAIAAYKEELKSYPDLNSSPGTPGVNETYMLGQAYIKQDPQDLPNGIFYLSRAAQYAPPGSKDSTEKAAKSWYLKYHGSMDGFDSIQQMAYDNANPPVTYKLVPAPPLLTGSNNVR